MKLYKTNQYKSATEGNKSGVVFAVFNDNERDTFAAVHAQLQQVYKMRFNNGLIDRWNEYDREAIEEILVWPKHFNDGGKMADLTYSQIGKIQKMLNKLFDDEVDFISMFDLSFDAGWDEETFMTEKEMRLEMDRRRQMKQKEPIDNSVYVSLFDWESLK